MTQTTGDLSKAVRSTDTAKTVNQLTKAWYARAQEATKDGGSLAWCMSGLPPELLIAFGVDAVWPENFGTVCAAKQAAVEFIEAAEAEGYSRDICSYVRNGLGYAARRKQLGEVPPEAPRGGMAEPKMLLAPTSGCDPRYKWFQSFRRYMDTPIHIYDVQSPPQDVDALDPRIFKQYVSYNLAQLERLVAFISAQTGRTLDKEKLAEALRYSEEARRLFYEVHELRKAVPSPMPSEDTFACIVPQIYMVGQRESVAFYQRLYDEVKDRVERGIGVIGEEKYRLMWVGIPMWFNMGIFNYLESLGAVSVMETMYYVGKLVSVEAKDPLAALAERMYRQSVELARESEETASGTTLAQRIIDFVQEYRVDGIIMHTVQSCRVVSIGHVHAANVLRDRLDIPTIILESDMGDPRSYSDAQIKMQINALLETLASKKRSVS